MNKETKLSNLRKKLFRRMVQPEIPLIVYVILFSTMALLWVFRHYIEDFAIDFIAELFGAAFTLFIVDVLLVRSKAKRWKVVRDNVDYLIARTINKLRDAIAGRAFGFVPKIDPQASQQQSLWDVSQQRGRLLGELGMMSEQQLQSRLNTADFFTDNNYRYFNEKADEIWTVLNVKYSEYFHPKLVALLIDLHVNLKDLCGHIRQHLKVTTDAEANDYYDSVGVLGVSVSMKKILVIVNELKQQGYSETASLDNSAASAD